MFAELSDKFFDDLDKLKKEDKKLHSKVWDLIADIKDHFKTPKIGIGHPEELKGDMAGHYSRHISDKHRLIYRIEGATLLLISCYGHYDDK